VQCKGRRSARNGRPGNYDEQPRSTHNGPYSPQYLPPPLRPLTSKHAEKEWYLGSLGKKTLLVWENNKAILNSSVSTLKIENDSMPGIVRKVKWLPLLLTFLLVGCETGRRLFTILCCSSNSCTAI
jgi:hypothetical protein